jgi:hypothetical protein
VALVGQLAILTGVILAYFKSDSAKSAADAAKVHAESANVNAADAANKADTAAAISDQNGRLLSSIRRGITAPQEQPEEMPARPKGKPRVAIEEDTPRKPQPAAGGSERRVGTTREEWNRRLREAGLPELPPER